MHKKLLIISQAKNADDANKSALDFCIDLVKNDTKYDSYIPIKESKRFNTVITETSNIDNPKILKEIKSSITSGLQEYKFWMKKAEKEKQLVDKILDYRIAVSNETFNVFDNTGWSGGDYITDMKYFAKIIKYMSKKYKDPFWVTAFDMHY